MTRVVARAPILLLLALGIGPAAAATPARTVFLAGGLSPEQLLILSTNIAASEHPGILLLDSGKTTPHHKRFLAGMHVEQLVPIGCFNEDAGEIEQRLGVATAPPLEWTRRRTRRAPRPSLGATFPSAISSSTRPREGDTAWTGP